MFSSSLAKEVAERTGNGLAILQRSGMCPSEINGFKPLLSDRSIEWVFLCVECLEIGLLNILLAKQGGYAELNKSGCDFLGVLCC
jgi:hypothetical protein